MKQGVVSKIKVQLPKKKKKTESASSFLFSFFSNFQPELSWNVQRGPRKHPASLSRVYDTSRKGKHARHNQVAGVVWRNICAEHKAETTGWKWVENDDPVGLPDHKTVTDILTVTDNRCDRCGHPRRWKPEDKWRRDTEEINTKPERAWWLKATVVPISCLSNLSSWACFFFSPTKFLSYKAKASLQCKCAQNWNHVDWV